MEPKADSDQISLLRESFNINFKRGNPVIALAGNPNTGKSTVFNGLTGLKQDTGNWPGKTVTQAQGYYTYQNQDYILVDLPGTYSLLANSTDEQVARDFICFAQPDATIVVVDATKLERNLNLVLQIMELTNNVVVCLNLMDEARRKNIEIDVEGLSQDLQIPIIPTVAPKKIGLEKLKDKIADIVTGRIKVTPKQIKYSSQIEEAIEKILPDLEAILPDYINSRWVALQLIEGDNSILEAMQTYYPEQIVKEITANLQSEVKAGGAF
ncbi:FeoB small GTPase domain-containing protein [Acetohalobium arabaticum]|uniref:GTP-binding protein HSR1-related protein n=1 Tax=Acetohalobium arabaticum (strain ATCC 49924 / DSM 5501 / Z-7288) TaxID=574087 RepID=D9QSA8_ACEAZ|nr:FeoB small GTPase domain-containing protein [Acetohalobium arabaticum]ADL11564.1 GTP-binding protein HSR1-related protein [Acetohalobium arabaticum DSM 5501]